MAKTVKVNSSFIYNSPAGGVGTVYQKGQTYEVDDATPDDPYIMAHLGDDPVSEGIDHATLTPGAFAVAESTEMKAQREQAEAAAREARAKSRAIAKEAAEARAKIAADEARAQAEAAARAQEAAHAPAAHAAAHAQQPRPQPAHKGQ